MATETTNYGLKKPDAEDFYNVEDFNGNFDKVDAALKGLEDTDNEWEEKWGAAYNHSQEEHAPVQEMLYDGEITSGSATMQNPFMRYSDIELLCVTTGDAYPFSVRMSVAKMNNKDLFISKTIKEGYLSQVTLNFAASGKTLTIKDNKVINLSNGSTIPVGAGVKIYKIIGYKA